MKRLLSIFLSCAACAMPVAAQGARMVADIHPTGPSNPRWITVFGGAVYFSAYTLGEGSELWRSDGTASGTWMVADLVAGPTGSDPQYLTVLGDRIVFAARGVTSSIRQLWTSDGTAAGTVPLARTGRIPRNLGRIGDRIYFSDDNTGSGVEMYVTDGTPAGTGLFMEIAFGSNSSNPGQFTPLGTTGQFLFSASDFINGQELWISDGTPANTRMVANLVAGSFGSGPSNLFAWQGRVWFDGAKTFTSIDRALWVSDGTAAGTTIVKVVRNAKSFAALGGKLFFNGQLPFTSSPEMWETDGTAAGTVAVGHSPNQPPDYSQTVGSRRFYFAGNGGLTAGSQELFASDGTVAGTQIVADIWPGPSGSDPMLWNALLGSLVFFSADDGVNGRELWVVDNGATASSAGAGIGVPGRKPFQFSTDPLIGQISSLAGGNAFPGASGFVLLGLPAIAPLRLPSGHEFYFDFSAPVPTLHAFTATASWSHSVLIPAVPSFAGASLMVQTGFLGTDNPTGLDLTNGVHWTLGN